MITNNTSSSLDLDYSERLLLLLLMIILCLGVIPCGYAAFQGPRTIENINEGAGLINSPQSSMDRLTLYISYGGDIAISRRNDVLDTFAVPSVISELDSPYRDEGMVLTSDSLFMIFSSNARPDQPYGIAALK
jgi:hypothetical protein